MKVLFLGDIVGRCGRQAVEELLPVIGEKYSWDICLANGENAAGGKGITEAVAHDLLNRGIDGLTMGNHTWDKREVFEFINHAGYMARPANYPPDTPGNGHITLDCDRGRLGVINLAGQAFMPPLDCPFASLERILPQLEQCTYLLVDFHAEATAEKVAMGRYLDGRVSAVVGTHTHIQTADEQVLPKGTLYITDVGMCGAIDSVLGMEIKPVLDKFTTKLPKRFSAARGRGMINAVWLDFEQKIIKRIRICQQ